MSARSGHRVICYCDDCQSFAHLMERTGDTLDAHGGTDIFQTSPACLEFTAGADRLACVRLRPGGLVRWYAACCDTPIGNTLDASGIPFVGLIHRCMDHTAGGCSRDEALGPVRARVQGRFARGDRSNLDAYDAFSLLASLRPLGIVLAARLHGDHKRSPFFDAATGERTVSPRILSAEELARVEAARDAA